MTKNLNYKKIYYNLLVVCQKKKITTLKAKNNLLSNL